MGRDRLCLVFGDKSRTDWLAIWEHQRSSTQMEFGKDEVIGRRTNRMPESYAKGIDVGAGAQKDGFR